MSLHANAFADGMPICRKSVQNANDQATLVARSLAGDPEPYHVIPGFWSNQYHLWLQTIVLPTGHTGCDIPSRNFSIVYLKDSRVIALDCFNATRDYVQGKALVAAGVPIAAEKLRDVGIPLRFLLAAPAG